MEASIKEKEQEHKEEIEYLPIPRYMLKLTNNFFRVADKYDYLKAISLNLAAGNDDIQRTKTFVEKLQLSQRAADANRHLEVNMIQLAIPNKIEINDHRREEIPMHKNLAALENGKPGMEIPDEARASKIYESRFGVMKNSFISSMIQKSDTGDGKAGENRLFVPKRSTQMDPDMRSIGTSHNTENNCFLCCERPSAGVFLPCCHGGACEYCSLDNWKKTKKCYLCKQVGAV